VIAISNATSKLIDSLLVGLLAIQAFAWRLPFLGTILTSDPAIRAYLSQEILAGSVPYRDIFNNKPPVIFYLGAFFSYLANDPSLGYWLMEAAFVVLASLAVYVSVRRISSPFTAFVFASIFVLFSNVSVFYYFTPGFIEYPAAALTAWAYVLTLHSRSNLAQFAAGILVVLTLMSHQLSLIACMPIWFWLAFHHRWRELSSHFLGMTLSLGLLLVWLHGNGALDGLIYQAFIFGYFYFRAHPAEIAEYRLPYLYYLLVPIPFILASIPFVIKKNNDSLLILLWLLSAAAALLLTGLRLYAHYFVILAAPMTLALANAWAVAHDRLPKMKSRRRFAIAAAFFLLLALTTAYSSRAYFDRTQKRILVAESKNFENPYVELVEYINKFSFKGKQRRVLYVGFGNPAVVALLTNTRMPRPYAYFGDFYSVPHPRQSTMTQEWIAEIQSNIPTLVIEDKRHFYPVPEALSNWIKENYVLIHEVDEFRVLAAANNP
jgi:4-amino-4-deoxy-L-arabinose transferase-like glycosyltransferase